MQTIVVAITFLLNALDGFDVLSISFASPGIAQEWDINRSTLGIVLSMELIGMAIGSILLGGVADTSGRRPTMLGCLIVMVIGMFMVTTVNSLVQLSIWRILTGFGIGGMIASINACVAEFSNNKRRHLSVSLMAIGFPLGAVFGGFISQQLLITHDWRSVFYLGASMTAICIPLVYFLVPESVHWLTHKQPDGALEKINRTLKRMGHVTINALPKISLEIRKRSIGDIFSVSLIAITLIVTTAYFFHVMTYYFIVKWLPKIMFDMGFTASDAAGVLVWTSLGGALGGAVLGIMTLKFGIKPLTIGLFLLSSVMVLIFGHSPADLNHLSIICFCAGFFINAGIIGMYAIFVQAYPTHVRAFGTGFSVGIGRGGSVLAPIIAGFLFDGGFSLATVATFMASGSLLAAGALIFLKLKPDHPATDFA